MSKTLLLDLNAWDLVLDSSGNIALASEPYSVVQDVASALRTFAGDSLSYSETKAPINPYGLFNDDMQILEWHRSKSVV